MAWYDDAIIYQIYPKSFHDSNGDGIGDLNGIRQKIPYLKALGINTVWLNPVYASPQVDNGYDVADYYAIDPSMGTMADMTALIDALHQAGLRLVMDFVLNHTSDQHPWFQAALRDPKGPYRDYYLFTGDNNQVPNNWASFFGGPAWTLDPSGSGQSYLHLFDRRMPDLNWANPALRAEMAAVATFWLGQGVDGLRLDAFIHVAKADLRQDYPLADDDMGPVQAEPFFANLPAVQTWVRPLAQQIKKTFPDAFLLGEAASADVNLAVAYTRSDAKMMDAVISFRGFADDERHLDARLSGLYQPKPLDSLRFKQNQAEWQQGLAGVSLPVLYWSNHDMARVASRYGQNDQVLIKSLALAMYLQRGLPLIYYGEELGVTNQALPTAEAFKDQTVTTFMTQAQAAGYTEEAALAMVNQTHKLAARGGMPWQANHRDIQWLPGQPGEGETVDLALADPDSVLHFYQAVLRLKQTPLFTKGPELILTTPDDVFAYQREWQGELGIVAVNFGEKEATLAVPAGLQVRLASGAAQLVGTTVLLPAHTGIVLT